MKDCFFLQIMIAALQVNKICHCHCGFLYSFSIFFNRVCVHTGDGGSNNQWEILQASHLLGPVFTLNLWKSSIEPRGNVVCSLCFFTGFLTEVTLMIFSQKFDHGYDCCLPLDPSRVVTSIFSKEREKQLYLKNCNKSLPHSDVLILIEAKHL